MHQPSSSLASPPVVRLTFHLSNALDIQRAPECHRADIESHVDFDLNLDSGIVWRTAFLLE